MLSDQYLVSEYICIMLERILLFIIGKKTGIDIFSTSSLKAECGLHLKLFLIL
jgi:hypothetical protein